MFDTSSKLEISQAQIDVIEAALQTQSKILHVQAEAGGHGAHEQLNEVKTLLALLDQNKTKDSKTCGAAGLGWFGLSKSLP